MHMWYTCGSLRTTDTVGSPPVPCGTWVSSSGHQAWRQAPLPAELYQNLPFGVSATNKAFHQKRQLMQTQDAYREGKQSIKQSSVIINLRKETTQNSFRSP